MTELIKQHYEVIIAITALVIAIASFFMSLASARESKKNNRILSRPRLVGLEHTSDTAYSYRISNNGSGPALFVSVEWFWNGELIVEENIKAAIDQVLRQHKFQYRLSITNPGEKNVMRPGETLVLGDIRFAAADGHVLEKIRDKGFEVRIRYRSEHGELFTYASDDKLLDCPGPK